ncbi:ABC transporter permease [Dethiobacter alkaliphilus]|uniref:ABC transporter permease n=1 Tax=Dethiobacter alkaliphilus TaxID=427926 RepID=UPI002225E77A|nr:ABC transporter permease [Dethiobacter alkaliphilus]MCW3490182.1 ABC transporter permease [Dethiobacter alkaliphilus]
MTIFYFVFKRFFRKIVSNALLLLLLPLITVFMPVGEWYPLPQGFHLYALVIMFIAARVSGIIMDDRMNRTLLRIEAAPVTHFQYLWQNLLAYTLILSLSNLLVVVSGLFVHGEALISPLLIFVLYTFFSVAVLGFCLAWYSLFRNKEAAFALLSGVVTLIAMLGGVMWPVQAMPDYMQRAVMLLPTYWLTEGLLEVSFGANLFDLSQPIGIMLLQAIAFLLVGSRRPLA